jgi:hypothetical protein
VLTRALAKARGMSKKRKLQTEIEGREPIDPDAVSRLIDATKDFRDGARSYLDDLEGQAIGLLELDKLPKVDRAALELLSNVLRPAFDDLADTFVEPYRETKPALAERGYQMLWVIMKAAADMAGVTHDSIARRKAADKLANARYCKLLEREGFAEAVKTEADRIGRTPAKSDKFVLAVAPGLQERIGSKKKPGKDKIFAAVDLIKQR